VVESLRAMKRALRILVVVLALVASLRDAGAAACASTCAMPLAAPMSCAESTGCGDDSGCTLPADCPLLDPAPFGVIERAPSASTFHPDFRRPLPPLAAILAGDAASPEAPVLPPACRASPTRSERAGPEPLWLVDCRLLI
jgi:hypothetical protein